MLIRKLFRYEMSHRVLGAYTKRCSLNVHGHSYVAELVFEGDKPDDAQMVMDFGFVKNYFHPFIDSFDHAHALWSSGTGYTKTWTIGAFEKNDADITHIKQHNDRWIELPFSSTAEMQSKMFYNFGVRALRQLQKENIINEHVRMHSAIVHETTTGYAEYRAEDAPKCMFPAIDFKDITFSEGIRADWSPNFKAFYSDLLVN